MRQITVDYAVTPTGNQKPSGTPVPLNFDNAVVGIGFICKISGGSPTYSVEHTYDNIMDPTVTPTWMPHGVANMTNATTTQESNFVIPIAGMRVNITGSGQVELVVIQQGH